MTFRVLFVCTGNICRSPLAQLILAHHLSDISEIEVVSAGTQALVGSPVPEPAARLAAEHDLIVEGHRAAQLDTRAVEAAGLVLTMAREHRTHVVQASPRAIRRTFTLREFARLVPIAQPQLPHALSGISPATVDGALDAAVGLVGSLRGVTEPPESPADFDVEDPYRRSDDVYRRSFAVLAPAAETVAAYLGRAARQSN